MRGCDHHQSRSFISFEYNRVKEKRGRERNELKTDRKNWTREGERDYKKNTLFSHLQNSSINQ